MRCETPEQKREFVERLLRVWEQYPYMRFGQILTLAGLVADRGRAVDDDEFIRTLELRASERGA